MAQILGNDTVRIEKGVLSQIERDAVLDAVCPVLCLIPFKAWSRRRHK